MGMTRFQKFNTIFAKVFCVIFIIVIPYYWIDTLITVGPLAILGILDGRFWGSLFILILSIISLFDEDPLNYLHR